MESLLDKVTLTAVCLIAFIAVPPDAVAIALLLGSFTVAVIAGLIPERPSLALLVAALAFATAYPPAAVFLAPVVYGCVSSRFRWMRWLWLVVPFLAFWRLPLEPWALGAAFDLIACVLALRCSMLLRERRQYRVLRDGVRERSLALERRNLQLSAQVKALEGEESGSDRNESAKGPLSDLRPTLSLANLTERELEIAAHVARGLDNREIAAEVFVSEGTVRNHISAILQKSGLRNRTQLAVAYLNTLGL